MRPVDSHPLIGVRKRFGRSKLLPLDEATGDLDTASESPKALSCCASAV